MVNTMKAMLLCIVYAMLFVNTLNMKIIFHLVGLAVH